MFETIYEISKTPFPGLTVFAICWLFFSLVGLITSIKCKQQGNAFKVLLFGSCLLVGIVLFYFSIEIKGSDDYQYAQMYYEGDYEIVEGYIEDYSSGKGASYFTVKDKDFSVYNFLFPSIPESGYVKVYYVELDDYHKAVRVDQKVENS